MPKITIELEPWEVGAKLERVIREDYSGIAHGKEIQIVGLTKTVISLVPPKPSVRDAGD